MLLCGKAFSLRFVHAEDEQLQPNVVAFSAALKAGQSEVEVHCFGWMVIHVRLSCSHTWHDGHDLRWLTGVVLKGRRDLHLCPGRFPLNVLHLCELCCPNPRTFSVPAAWLNAVCLAQWLSNAAPQKRTGHNKQFPGPYCSAPRLRTPITKMSSLDSMDFWNWTNTTGTRFVTQMRPIRTSK